MTQSALNIPLGDVAVAMPPTASARGHESVLLTLNTFQALMRRWCSLGPYSAGQIMRISGAPDLERWRKAAEYVLKETGLGRPDFVGDMVRFRPLPRLTIEQVQREIDAYISDELNRPFTDAEPPIRFFTKVLPDGSHYLGAIYDHWIADSRAMRELMHRIFLKYQSPEAPHGLPPLTLVQPPFHQIFRRHIRMLPWINALRYSLRNIFRHRNAYRINLAKPLDFTSQVIYRELPPGLIDQVHKYAKSHQASVNDAFLAVLGQTMGQYTADDRLGKRRKRFHFSRYGVGLGTIVDIRDAASEPLDNVFGLYLSSYTNVLENPEQDTIPSLIEQIGARTRYIKKRFSSVRGYAALTMARFGWDWYPRRRTQSMMFHKNVPMTAGISNVNMTRSWVDAAGRTSEPGTPMVLDYVRISPTGPLLPLVFTLTTIGPRLSLCVTYRTTAFTAAQANGIIDDFVRRLSEMRPEAKPAGKAEAEAKVEAKP